MPEKGGGGNRVIGNRREAKKVGGHEVKADGQGNKVVSKPQYEQGTKEDDDPCYADKKRTRKIVVGNHRPV